MKHRNRCVFKAYNKSVCERGGGIDTKQERERVCYCDRVHLPDLVLEKKVKDGENCWFVIHRLCIMVGHRKGIRRKTERETNMVVLDKITWHTRIKGESKYEY